MSQIGEYLEGRLLYEDSVGLLDGPAFFPDLRLLLGVQNKFLLDLLELSNELPVLLTILDPVHGLNIFDAGLRIDYLI